MKYEPDKLQLLDKVSPGSVNKAIVVEIISGQLADFLSEEGKVKWPVAKLSSTYIEVHVEWGDGQRATKLIAVPETNLVHPKSSLAAWKETFGDWPHVSQEVFVIANTDGRFEVKL